MPDVPPLPDRDTIVAIATPPGRGGIGIVRLSGSDACAIAKPLLNGAKLEHQQARFCHIVKPATGEKLDEGVVTYFAAPRSYTGEDVVEIAAHGSPVLLDHLLQLALAGGARLAEPGEFTERAFLSGRLDLTQAEAVRDLIDAQTLLQAQVAAQQLGGALSRHVRPIKEQLIALIAILEAGIDFAEDDTPVLSYEEIETTLVAIEQALTSLAHSFARGRLLAEGVTLAIVGRPNAGKSSLFNRLLDRERAIVTAEPGTTRDTVKERLSIGGVPVELIDTAGLRDAGSEAERIGIEKSRQAFADADLILLVLNSTEALNREEEALLMAAEGRRLLVALNKCDLLAAAGIAAAADQPNDAAQTQSPLQEQAFPVRTHSAQQDVGVQSELAAEPSARVPLLTRLQAIAPSAPWLLTCALTDEGVNALRAQVQTMLLGEQSISTDSAMLTNLRQHTAVTAAIAGLEKALDAGASGLPHEMLLLDLYEALASLDTLTGVTTPDDVLQLIFSTFCIGK